MRNYKACKNRFSTIRRKKESLNAEFQNKARLTILMFLVALVIIDFF